MHLLTSLIFTRGEAGLFEWATANNLSAAGACLSAAAALYAVVKAESASRLTKEVQKQQKEINEWHINKNRKEAEEERRGGLLPELIPDGDNYQLRVSNVGKARARKIRWTFTDPFNALEIPGVEIREKSEYPELLPGQSYSITACRDMGRAAGPIPVDLRWFNDDEERQEKSFTISES